MKDVDMYAWVKFNEDNSLVLIDNTIFLDEKIALINSPLVANDELGDEVELVNLNNVLSFDTREWI